MTNEGKVKKQEAQESNSAGNDAKRENNTVNQRQCGS